MTDREAMQMALDANAALLEFIGMTSKSDFPLALAKVTEANKALRTALAQPKKEWVGLTDDEAIEIEDRSPDIRWAIIQAEDKLREKNA